MTVVDLHAHLVPEILIDALTKDGPRIGVTIEEEEGKRFARFADGFRTGLPFFPDITDAHRRLDQQATMGVDIQVLSGWNDMYGYMLQPDHGQALSRLTNDALAETVKLDPVRLAAIGTVPLQAPALAAVEVRYLAGHHGIRGIQIGTGINGAGLDDTALDVFWAACASEGTFVFIHPGRVDARDRFARYYTSNLVGNPIETTLAAADLLMSGVFERFPDLVVGLAHGGGFLPYQVGRLQRGYQTNAIARSVAQVEPADAFRHFYFDTITYDQEALRFLVRKAGANKVLFGTDMPFPLADRSAVADLQQALAEWSESDRDAILGENAVRVLGL